MNELKISLHIAVGILIFCFACISAIVNFTEVSVWLCIVAVVLISRYIIKKQQQFFSLTLIFWLFSALYGLSTPILIIRGEELPAVFAFGNLAENVNPFLVAYSLSCIGFILGFISNKSFDIRNKQRQEINLNENIVKTCIYISAVFASLFEVINMLRIGGVSMLLLGKGVYQSLVGDLFLTLPSESMCIVCGMFFGMHYGYKKSKNEKAKYMIRKTIILLIPFLFCKIILGQRGVLVSTALLFLASYTVFCSIKRITVKNIITILAMYLFLIFLYTNRSIVGLLMTNPSEFMDKAFNLERLSANINPANNEFGAAFGNFCVFFEKYGMNFEKYYGLTYLEGVLVPIPSFLFLGGKPLAITYVFRDEFFSSWATYSRIASTGFSSILEAYINGGFIGVVIVYAVIGKLIYSFDRLRLHYVGFKGIILTSLLVPTCMDFSRNSFGGTFGVYIWNCIFALSIYFLAFNIQKNR